MVYILTSMFLLFLLSQARKNKFYTTLCLLQLVSFAAGPLVANYFAYSSVTTLVNCCYMFLNIALIILPWRNAEFAGVYVSGSELRRVSKWLAFILFTLMLIGVTVMAVVFIYIPDISKFKNERAFLELYQTIPYFSSLFRITAVTQYLGLFAIPLSGYYLHLGDKRKALLFFVLSLSTFVSAVALYSRAVMMTYLLVCVGFFLLTYRLYDTSSIERLQKYFKRGLVVSLGIFLAISIIRFSAMSYYADRIPKESLIQEPTAYSLVDYASQGIVNGIEQLEYHREGNIMYGEASLYNIKLMLSFFGLIDWNSQKANELRYKVYAHPEIDAKNDAGAFHAYTCTMVKDFGYIVTLLLNIIYYIYISSKCRRKNISLYDLFLITLLMTQPCISIFYASWGELVFPLLFLVALRMVIRL